MCLAVITGLSEPKHTNNPFQDGVVTLNGTTYSVEYGYVFIDKEGYWVDSDGHLTQTHPDCRSEGYYVLAKDGKTSILKLPNGMLESPLDGDIKPLQAISIQKNTNCEDSRIEDTITPDKNIGDTNFNSDSQCMQVETSEGEKDTTKEAITIVSERNIDTFTDQAVMKPINEIVESIKLENFIKTKNEATQNVNTENVPAKPLTNKIDKPVIMTWNNRYLNTLYIDADGHLANYPSSHPNRKYTGFYCVLAENKGFPTIRKSLDGKILSSDKPQLATDVLKDKIAKIHDRNTYIVNKILHLDRYINNPEILGRELKSLNDEIETLENYNNQLVNLNCNTLDLNEILSYRDWLNLQKTKLEICLTKDNKTGKPLLSYECSSLFPSILRNRLSAGINPLFKDIFIRTRYRKCYEDKYLIPLSIDDNIREPLKKIDDIDTLFDILEKEKTTLENNAKQVLLRENCLSSLKQACEKAEKLIRACWSSEISIKYSSNYRKLLDEADSVINTSYKSLLRETIAKDITDEEYLEIGNSASPYKKYEEVLDKHYKEHEEIYSKQAYDAFFNGEKADKDFDQQQIEFAKRKVQREKNSYTRGYSRDHDYYNLADYLREVGYINQAGYWTPKW